MTTMISTVIALPYELARLPLTVVDKTLAGRMAETSTPRVTMDRAIGTADKVAGALLGNDGIAQRGADRIERSDKILTAARLEQEADARLAQAARKAASGRQEATRKRHEAKDRAATGLVEADAAEARAKKAAKAKAARTAATKKAAADQRAASRTATIEKRKDRVASSAEAKKKTTQRAAKAELNDARTTKQSAAEARADAKRLADLTEAKKQERTQA